MWLTRKDRGKTQQLFLIECLKATEPLVRKYIVMGTTGNVYEVTIKDKPICTCPDYIKRHRRCKHIYFVLLRIMKVTKINEDKKTFTQGNLKEMFKNIPQITKNLVVKDSIKQTYKNIKPTKIVNKKGIDDICPICLSDLDDGKELDYCKYSCGKQVHILCFKMWSSYHEPNCVFCRQSWVSTKYINLLGNE